MRYRYLILITLALSALAPGITTLPVMDRQEAQFAQVSRALALSDEAIDPSDQQGEQFRSLSGFHWVQAATLRLSRQEDASEIWVYRVPSVLAAALASVALAWAGLPLLGPRAATIAGGIIATLLIVQTEARLAKADAALLLASVLAMGGLFRAYLTTIPLKTVILFWTAIAAGLFLDGPVILLPIIGATLWFWILEGKPIWLNRLRPVQGLALTAVVLLPWYGPAMLDGETTFAAVVFAETQEGQGWRLGSHALTFWFTFWPWSVLAPLTMVWTWRHRNKRLVHLVAAWCLPAWIMLECMPTKMPQDTLLLYPGLILLVAATAHALLKGHIQLSGWPLRLGRAAFLVVFFALISLALIGPYRLGTGQSLAAWLIAGSITTTALIALAALRRNRARAALALIGTTGVSTAIFLATLGLPRMETLWLAERMTQATRTENCLIGPVALVGFQHPSAGFLLGRDTTSMDVAGAKMALAVGDVAAAWMPEPPANRPVEHGGTMITGVDFANRRKVQLYLHVSPHARDQICPTEKD